MDDSDHTRCVCGGHVRDGSPTAAGRVHYGCLPADEQRRIAEAAAEGWLKEDREIRRSTCP